MRLVRVSLIIVATVFAFAACSPEGAAPDQAVSEPAPGGANLVGGWEGILQAGPARLSVELHVEDDEAGLSGYLISLDQGGARIPADSIVLDDQTLSLRFPAVGAAFEGRRVDDTLTGQFTQNGAGLPLTLTRIVTSAPPEAAASVDPLQQDVVVAGDVRLAGTLQRPAGEGPFPAVVLLNGSGSQDRDVTIGSQRVFAALADTLAEAGIASLRLDDRGIGGSAAIAPSSPQDLAGDAVRAMLSLRAQPGVDPACTGFLGHSEGSLVAFMAAEAAAPDFIVSLAGMQGSMRETLFEQAEALNRAAGASADQIAANRRLQEAVFAAMTAAPEGEAGAAIEAALIANGLDARAAAQQAAIWGQPYALASLDLAVEPWLESYQGPVLAMFAERDLQVLPEPNARRILAARGDLPTGVVTVTGVNHLFQTAQTGLPQEYFIATEPMAPAALDQIREHVGGLVQRACQR